MRNIILFSFLTTFFFVKADEGMWLPNLLSEINEEDMYMSGLRLTADDLYSVNNS